MNESKVFNSSKSSRKFQKEEIFALDNYYLLPFFRTLGLRNFSNKGVADLKAFKMYNFHKSFQDNAFALEF